MGRSTIASRARRNAEYLQHLPATFYCARCKIHGWCVKATRDAFLRHGFSDSGHHCCYDLLPPLPEEFAEAEQVCLFREETA